MRDALRPAEAASNWVGISFCVYVLYQSSQAQKQPKRVCTSSSFPFPLSFTENAYDVSRPVVTSFRFRNAWWGRAAVFPSWVVRITFSVSEAPNWTAWRRGLLGEILRVPLNTLFPIRKQKWFYFSLKPPPTPAPLPWTATVASVKPHEAPATSTEQQASRINERLEGRSCMVVCGQFKRVVATDMCWYGGV